MDQRAIVGQFLVFLLDRLLKDLARRLAGRHHPPMESNALLHDFARPLFDLSEVLNAPQKRKDELSALREKLSQEAQGAADDAELEIMKTSLRQQLLVPQEAIFAVVRKLMEKQFRQPPPVESGLLHDMSQAGPPGHPRII